MIPQVINRCGSNTERLLENSTPPAVGRPDTEAHCLAALCSLKGRARSATTPLSLDTSKTSYFYNTDIIQFSFHTVMFLF